MVQTASMPCMQLTQDKETLKKQKVEQLRGMILNMSPTAEVPVTCVHGDNTEVIICCNSSLDAQI